MREGHPRSG